MKHILNRVLSVVALLMLTLGTWAQTVDDVTVKITPEGAGTVVPSVNDKGVCTLTVTPATGYYLNKGNVTAVATLKGEAMQALKRALPINDGVLDVTQDANDVSKYSFTIPEGCQVEVTVEFYAGVTFDDATNTLTLNSAYITSDDDWAFEFGDKVSFLTVKLLGRNTINGNAFKFDGDQPAVVFTTDPFTSGSLTVTNSLTSPDEGKDGATVVYENGLQKAVAEAGSVISGTPINLTVGGTAVTSQNMGDILSDGKVTFDAQTLTLTLNGATIDMTQKDGYPIESDIQNLKVMLVGSNTLTPYSGKPYGFYYSNQANAGTLTFTHQENGVGSVTVDGSTAVASGYTVAYDTQETGWTVAETSIGYDAVFGVQIGGTAFTASALTMTSENGSATYHPLTQTLSLNNFTTTGALTTTLTNLTISLTGVNSVGAVSNNGQSQTNTLTIERNTASNAAVNKLTATQVTGFETVTVTDPLNEISAGVYSDVVTYSLWVNGTQVTRENMESVTAGVSFDGDHTLTLDNVTASTNDAPFITNGLSKLTIHLLGTNTVDCGQQLFLTKKDGDNDHQVTFTTNPNAVGRLTVSNVAAEWYTGHATPTYQNDLAVTSGEGTVTIAIPQVTEYGLSIAGIAVTNENAENVTGAGITGGSVKYDAIYEVLTLNGATINGDITSNIDELKIELKGVNTVTGFNRTAANKGKLKFALGGDIGNLTLTNAIPTENFDVTLIDNLEFYNDYKAIALPESYGISVASVAITRDNRTNVTGDGTVRFDNNARLVLEKADINGQIVVDNAATLPNNSLTIYLKGRNSIDSALPAIKCNSGTLKVAFEFDNQTESRIEIFSETPQVDENNAFNSVTLSNKNDLRFSSLTCVLKIEPYLPLIVDDQTQTATVDFSQMSASTNVNGTVVNKVEYNLGSETDDKENSSGIDQTTGKLVFGQNDVMTDAQIEQAKQNDDLFKGLKMVVPAGLIEVGLQGVDLPAGYDMGVSIGNQKPVSVRDVLGGVTPEDVLKNQNAVLSLIGAHSQELRLWVFPASVWNPAPQMASRRIGPKSSVAGGLGGISIKSSSAQAAKGPADTYKSMEMSAMASALKAVTDAHSGYCCNDPDITDLPDNMFLKMNTSNAPRRGSAVETILPEGLTFVDFSKTKITGMEISRTEGPFNGVPENVFIYMPAGNTTKEKNVVIGGICDNMELNGELDAQPFKAMKDFVAGQATLKRDFTEAGTGESKVRATIYLPYAISQEDANKLGKFYEYVSNDGTTVDMKMVTKGGLKANKPYIFEAKEGGVTNPMVRVVNVLANPVETEGFKGVYEKKNYEDGMYCYAGEARDNNSIGQFVEMGPGSYVPPFRAYIIGNGAPSYAIAWDGVVDDFQNEENATAVETVKTVKTVTSVKTQEGWWTISGMRLNAQPKKAGLYVKDGRLVVVK